MLVPKLFTTLKTYDRRQFVADVIAGRDRRHRRAPARDRVRDRERRHPRPRPLHRDRRRGFLISALGGSRVQIGGPTGAFVVIVYGIVQQHGVDGLMVATLMAGVILVALGSSGLGSAIKFIPHPGGDRFTSGIALIIFSSQMKDLLGLADGRRAGRLPREVAGVRATRWAR